jgi:hypothetical protein
MDLKTAWTLGLVACFVPATAAVASTPFADHVAGYVPGAVASVTYTQATAALGSPTRYTGMGVYPSAVTPFNPAFMPGEIVAIGAGGSLTLRFDEPVTDDAANPHGLDVIVFGNTFFADRTYPSGVVDGVFGPFADSVVEVSADGIDWRTLTGSSLNGFFPTLGYSDLADPYALAAGTIESDFTRPVNPAFDPTGLSFSQVVAAYAGSGGGTGLDIASSGLAAVSFLRISVTSGELLIDGVSDVAAVPSPTTLVSLGLLTAAASLRRRR